MKRRKWEERQLGDVFLSAVPGPIHDAIWWGETHMHPDAPKDFACTHAGIVGPYAGYVTEAWLGQEGDSVACVVEDTKYRADIVELWSLGAAPLDVEAAFQNFLRTYVGEHYGWEDLVGFGVKALFHDIGINIGNPIHKSLVCSMAVGAWLQTLSLQTVKAHFIPQLAWSKQLDLPDLDPLLLRVELLKHEDR